MEVDAGPKVSQIAEAVLLDEDRRGRLLGYACARFGISREDAEDLSQETFVRPTERYFDMLCATAAAQGLPDEAIEALDRARDNPQAPAPQI